MRTMIRRLARVFSKVLQRVITDSIKQLLRCFFESMQDEEFVT